MDTRLIFILHHIQKKDNRIIAKLRISEDVAGEKVMWYKLNPDKTFQFIEIMK